MPRLGRCLVLLGVAAVSACTTRLWVAMDAWKDPAPVALTTGLPLHRDEATAAFDARVKARFPTGAPMAEVGAELALEGFTRQDWTSLPGKTHFARRYDGGAPVCAIEALVSWTSDDDDRLTAIKGDYQKTCL